MLAEHPVNTSHAQPRPTVIRRHYYRCGDCLTPQVVEGPQPPATTACACGGKITHLGVVRRHRVVRLEDHPVCDGRCIGATGPSCDCQCGGEHHGSGRVVTVETADLGAARLTAVDAEAQIARATEYRAARDALDAAIQSCRLAWAFAKRRAGEYVHGAAYLECMHVHERRSHALHLRTHAGRIRALAALTDYVRRL